MLWLRRKKLSGCGERRGDPGRVLWDAVDDGALDLSGKPELVRAFSRWFTWSHFAPIVRAAAARRASL